MGKFVWVGNMGGSDRGGSIGAALGQGIGNGMLDAYKAKQAAKAREQDPEYIEQMMRLEALGEIMKGGQDTEIPDTSRQMFNSDNQPVTTPLRPA